MVKSIYQLYTGQSFTIQNKQVLKNQNFKKQTI